ncbi:MAG: P27 family phage terminase small subunit [Chloroflexi bacterium]|nr:P27 family phage terminase small subunit [Chloroflexota bacterium]
MAYTPTGQPRGRPPKPEHLRHGHRKGHLTVVQPEQQVQPRRVPRAPAGLLPQTRALWRDYWRSPVAQAADLDADAFLLERWIRAVDEWERVGEAFREVRFLWHDDRLVLNPLARYLHQLERTINYAETQLGLTPVARVRLGITIGQERLTAAALNRMLDEGARKARPAGSVVEAEEWAAEWEPA